MYHCTEFGKAGTAYQAYVAGTYDRNIHIVL